MHCTKTKGVQGTAWCILPTPADSLRATEQKALIPPGPSRGALPLQRPQQAGAHPWRCWRCRWCRRGGRGLRGRLAPSCCAAWLTARWSPPAGSAAPAHTAAPAAIFGCVFRPSPGNRGKPGGEEGTRQHPARPSQPGSSSQSQRRHTVTPELAPHRSPSSCPRTPVLQNAIPELCTIPRTHGAKNSSVLTIHTLG